MLCATRENPDTNVVAFVNHSSTVDLTAKRGISALDDQIVIWSLLIQYICTRVKNEKKNVIQNFRVPSLVLLSRNYQQSKGFAEPA